MIAVLTAIAAVIAAVGGLAGGAAFFRVRSQNGRDDAESDERRAKALTDVVEAATTHVVASVDQQLERLQQQLVSKEAEATAEREAKLVAIAERAQLAAELAGKEAALARLTAESHQERSRLQAELNEARHEIAELRDQVETLRAQLGDYERRHPGDRRS